MLTIAETTEGTLVRIAEIAAIVPAHVRPRVRCVLCEHALVPKLGTKLRHHFAHLPGSTCPAAGGEGEVHLAAKLHMTLLLRELIAARLHLPAPSACGLCGEPYTQALLAFESTDQVQIERSVGSRRPDLIVRRGDRVIAAIEIVVSNPCTDERWADLLSTNAVVVEVRGEDVLALSDTQTWLDDPIDYSRVSPLAQDPACPSCLAALDEEHRRPRAEAITRCALDVRFPDGRRTQDTFEVWREWDGTRWVRAFIQSALRGRLWELEGTCDDIEELRVRGRDVFRSYRAELVRGAAAYSCDTFAEDALPGTILAELASSWWWQPARTRWVQVYSFQEAAARLQIRRTTFGRWVKERRVRAIYVRRDRDSREDTRCFDAEDIDERTRRLENWRRTAPTLTSQQFFALRVRNTMDAIRAGEAVWDEERSG